MLGINVPSVPGVPDRDLLPITGPSHLEYAEAALLEYPHAIGLDLHLHVGRAGPFSEGGFGIPVSHDHYVKGLRGPEVTDGHLKLMQGHAVGRGRWHGFFPGVQHDLEISIQGHEIIVV